ncbi:hypothetical protein [Sphingomonas morindae]|uniref:Sel1 repeat family protein n=1 Tax=Sphingomonas morindae TaxID=1541170 RepID=A0ABY4X4J2_9SPHN|nr:hypothetical protein [Sphingomonas morindae]USI71800.1 hypothetical protein LHA26_10750 [Sphingomonas morindae]
MANSIHSARFLMESRQAEAAMDEAEALYDLGIACSTGARGEAVDLIEAHKWFNLASVAGSLDAQRCRAEIAEEMTAREIVEAQRKARAWLSQRTARAA